MLTPGYFCYNFNFNYDFDDLILSYFQSKTIYYLIIMKLKKLNDINDKLNPSCVWGQK